MHIILCSLNELFSPFDVRSPNTPILALATRERTAWPTSPTAPRGTACWVCCARPLNSALSLPSVPPWPRACKTSSPGTTFTTKPQYGAGRAGTYGLFPVEVNWLREVPQYLSVAGRWIIFFLFIFVLTALATLTLLTWCEWPRSSERKASWRTDNPTMTLPRRWTIPHVSLQGGPDAAPGCAQKRPIPARLATKKNDKKKKQALSRPALKCCKQSPRHLTTRSFVHFFFFFELNPTLHVEENALGAAQSSAPPPPVCSGTNTLIHLPSLAAMELFSWGCRKGFVHTTTFLF